MTNLEGDSVLPAKFHCRLAALQCKINAHYSYSVKN